VARSQAACRRRVEASVNLEPASPGAGHQQMDSPHPDPQNSGAFRQSDRVAEVVVEGGAPFRHPAAMRHQGPAEEEAAVAEGMRHPYQLQLQHPLLRPRPRQHQLPPSLRPHRAPLPLPLQCPQRDRPRRPRSPHTSRTSAPVPTAHSSRTRWRWRLHGRLSCGGPTRHLRAQVQALHRRGCTRVRSALRRLSDRENG